jgi:hypothetical protein
MKTVDVRHFTNRSRKIQLNQDVTVDFGNDGRHGALPKTIQIDCEGAAGTLETPMHFERHIEGRGRRLEEKPNDSAASAARYWGYRFRMAPRLGVILKKFRA